MISPNQLKTPQDIVNEKIKQGGIQLQDSGAEYAGPLGRSEYGEIAQAVIVESQAAGRWIPVIERSIFGRESRVEEMAGLGWLNISMKGGKKYWELTEACIERLESWYKK